MSDMETVKFEKATGIGRITLNRVEALNAFNTRMRDDLFEILQAVIADDDIKVVILQGAGEKAFCAGADLGEFLTAPGPAAARDIRFKRDVWKLMLSVPQPMIAKLHGYVLGSGLEMALCCDLRFCADNAKFRLPELSLGMIPAAGGTQTLPRVVGAATAMEMLLLDGLIPASEAHRLGIVNRIVPAGRLEHETTAAALKIASYDPASVRLVKQAIVRGRDLPLNEGLALEADLNRMLAGNRPADKPDLR